MVAVQEMTHSEFESLVALVRRQAIRVGLWSSVVIEDHRTRWAFWRRRGLDTGRMVVYVQRARRHPADVVADIRSAFVTTARVIDPDTHQTRSLDPLERAIRARALRVLSERTGVPTC